MKRKTTFFTSLLLILFLFGNLIAHAQPSELWKKTNTDYTWNADRYYRGMDFNPENNHLYVAGTEGAYTGDGSTVAEDNMIRILDGSTGELIKTISPSAVLDPAWGYGIRDVEVDDGGALFATTGTSNQFNPVQLYYWADEDADPELLWKDASGTADDFGGSFSVFGDFQTEALIIIPFVNVPKVYYFEVVNGVLGAVNTLDLTGLGAIRTPSVQALGTKITDGFWYNTVELAGPVKFNGTGNIVAQIPAGVITGVNQDVKEFASGDKNYLVVSNEGKILLINITGKAADLSDVTVADVVEIEGTAPVLESVWPHVYGNGQEQVVVSYPFTDTYIIYSLSGGNYIKALAPEAAPLATNLMMTGFAMVGSNAQVSYTYIDVNGDEEDVSLYKWYASDDNQGTNKTQFATDAEITVAYEHLNKYLSFSVLAVAKTGTLSSETNWVESGYYGPVTSTAVKPVASDLTIAGDPNVYGLLVGSYTFTDADGDTEAESILKWWRADDAAGTNAVKVAEDTLKYMPLPADEGKFILFSVIPVSSSPNFSTGDSVAVATATAVVFPAYVPEAKNVAISGIQEVGRILTGSYTYSDLNEDEEGNTVLTWYRADALDGTKTAVANDTNRYQLVAADQDKYIFFGVLPVTAADENGVEVFDTTGIIAPAPPEGAPEAQDVAFVGNPEVGAVVYGKYTYFDYTDDPEGASLFKWYVADDAAGTNKTVIDGANHKEFLVTDAQVGKFLIFEVTPVAVSGGLLTGEAVEAVSSAATIESTNDGDFERVWMRGAKMAAVPSYIGTGSTERGFALGTDHIYLASRLGGTKLVVLDKTSGSEVAQMNTEGMDAGLFKISDVEVSDDGQILACPLVTDASAAPFVIYKWTDELAAPVKWIEFTSTVPMRLGDKFTVKGDVSANAVIFAAASANKYVIRWVVTGGIVGDPTVIELQNTTSVGSTAAVAPFEASADSKFLVDGRGMQPQIFDKDGMYLGAIEGVGMTNNQSNSPNIFTYKGRTLAAFYQKNDAGVWNTIVKDITTAPYVTVGVSETMSTANQELGGVHVEADEEFFHMYMLSANQGIARFKGLLELPMFEYAETNDAGDKIFVWFSKNMPDSLGVSTGWTVMADDVEIAIDTLYGTGTDANVVTFELATAITNGQTVTIAYDGTGTTAAFDAMPLSAFEAEEVVNIVGVAAPTATDVAIVGDPVVGKTLEGSYTYADADGDLEGASKYQWWYSTDAEGTDKLKILGATTDTWVVDADRTDMYVAFEVTPVALTGGLDFLVGEPVLSAFVLIKPVGVADNLAAAISMYPNPVNNQLTIKGTGNVTRIQVVDFTGRIIMTQENTGLSEMNLNMSSLKAGVYMIQAVDLNGQSAVKRIVKN